MRLILDDWLGLKRNRKDELILDVHDIFAIAQDAALKMSVRMAGKSGTELSDKIAVARPHITCLGQPIARPECMERQSTARRL